MAQVSRMMIFHVTILLFVAVLACNCQDAKKRFEYIEMPFQELDHGMRDTGRIWLALKSLDVGRDSSPEFVLNKLQDFRDKADYKLDKEDMDKLIGLADDGDECRYGQYELFMKVYLTLFRTQTIESAEEILDFLLHYGELKYLRCATKIKKEFRSKLAANAYDVGEIDDFFTAALFLPIGSSDEEILAKLRNFKLSQTRVNMDALALISEKGLTDEPGVAARVLAKLSQTCDRLVRSFDMDFNVLNLAMWLDPNQDYFRDDIQLQKLNEVHRICLERESNKYAVYRKMEEQVKPRHRSLYPIASE